MMQYREIKKWYPTKCGAMAWVEDATLESYLPGINHGIERFTGHLDYRGHRIEVDWLRFSDSTYLRASRWTNYIVPENEREFFPFDIDIEVIPIKCECGADKIEVDSHSPWCPKF
jgi:hypothetical protein